METTTYYQSPIGIVRIIEKDSLVQSITTIDNAEVQTADTPPIATEECVKQLKEYFAGDRTTFDFPYQYDGTAFQRKVWAELEKIPFGTTISYKELALRLGDVKSIRAAGTANGKNPLWIVVPCHRVIGSDGKLVGYAGGLWRKQWLLQHEERLAGVQQPTLFG